MAAGPDGQPATISAVPSWRTSRAGRPSPASQAVARSLRRIAAVLAVFASTQVAAAFAPFVSSYKTFWLGLGAIALDLLLALVVTSLVRNRLGHRSWRRVHWLAYACWPIGLAHGLGIGTDRATTWVFALTVACAAAVAGAATWRLVTAVRLGAR